MGGGTYSASYKGTDTDGTALYARANTTADAYFLSTNAADIFKQKQLHVAMNPQGVTIRESRDSVEHPNSLAIVLALDVTGSMQDVPDYLVKKGLPNIMGNIIQKGIKDPQILFLGIGDHECDSAPLQVSQFESSDTLLDKWLTELYLEGGGGGNKGESYLLAWYFAGKHTSIDCFEKRGEKGFLFTIGDEPVLPAVPARYLTEIMGAGQYDNGDVKSLLAEAQKMYNVYHLHITETPTGSRPETIKGWQKLMGEKLVVVDQKENVAKVISDIISRNAVTSTPPEGQTEVIL
jgi:hypothetical protein